MMPINVFVSERRAANLLAQIRWRDGVYCPRCRAESVIRYGSYRVFQRYLEGVIELLSHRDDRAPRIVSAFVVGDSDDEAKA
ncbi:Transposase zinc-ribbon domain-containing protein, partial [Halorientalis persicus]